MNCQAIALALIFTILFASFIIMLPLLACKLAVKLFDGYCGNCRFYIEEEPDGVGYCTNCRGFAGRGVTNTFTCSGWEKKVKKNG